MRWSSNATLAGTTAAALIAACLCGAAPAVAAERILFVGNSFTFAAYSPAMHYRPESVTDINREGIGGVPALFKRFTEEAGLDYEVSLETSPGKPLEWHWDTHKRVLDQAWDHVLLQSYSTLNAANPGDASLLIEFTRKFADLFRARNPKVDVRLTATWSRPDKTYAAGSPSPWSGKDIFAMADDLERASEQAAAAAKLPGVTPVGEAFSRAIRTGVADPNPYDGIEPGKVDLWAVDHYHASTAGYYLEALMLFGAVTGRDPQSLGAGEAAGRDLGLPSTLVTALERVAHDELAARR